MNKFKFIKQLLENEKFNTSQKDRVLKLVSRELESSSKRDDQVLSDIKRIKEKIGLDDVNIEKNKIEFPDLTIPKDGLILGKSIANSDISKPNTTNNIVEYLKEDGKQKKENKKASMPVFMPSSNLTSFLKAYNQHPILKYTCHLIDSEDVIEVINQKCKVESYQFQKHLELIINAFNSFKKEHFIDTKIVNLILVYLTGESFTKKIKTWSTDNVKVNWSSQELIIWSQENMSAIPNPGLNIARNQRNKGFVFPGFRSNIHNKRIRSFSELVLHFKNLFHLKGDNSLLSIIKNINQKNNWNDIVDFNINKIDFDVKLFKENIELFTDVDGLKKGYINILNLILESSSNGVKPIVNLTFTNVNNQIVFSIHHINTIITKKSANDFASRLGESHINIIKNLNGICSLYLKAEFKYEEFYEINLWDKETRKEKKIDSFKGVEHILKF
ncbi:hypothetical protein [Olleya sp.]|jgi:hypothetical protein|uniref:hypothetical protein n=1 Tax=Olleya sp. TaxID=1906788 RepID=UPI0032D91C27